MTKDELRAHLRQARQAHVAALPAATRGLLFRRPPAPLLELIPPGSAVGLYRATANEAPAGHYAAFFHEASHPIALPRFADRTTAMEFRRHTDPHGESDLEHGPFGIRQPGEDGASIDPAVVFVPLLGFTAQGHRLGQGGGHYDRWLAGHPGVRAIGLAWDCQLAEKLPVETHDIPLSAVVTPTRFYGPFA